MPTLTIDGKTVEVAEGTRLTTAISNLGIAIGHRCGGNARCTTCRVSFRSGEPDVMTEAEYLKLKERGLLGTHRLSCQLVCEHDMELEVAMTKESEGWSDTGPALSPSVGPEAIWYPIEELQQR